MSIPIVMTAAGAQPADPNTLRTNLLDIATGLDPGLTANLPATLIEDIASTDVGALTVLDSAYVGAINSISATTANPFILNQLGQLYGVQQGLGANASVYVEFTGTVGFLVNAGFIVSDGTNQYVVQEGAAIPTGGTTQGLFCVAIQPGTFAIPANSVTTTVTSIPSGITLTCNNSQPGTPASAPETLPEYQAAVVQAGQSTAQGMPTFLKTQLGKVPGIQQRLISVQLIAGQWIVVAGGGDPYQTAAAIYLGVPDISNLSGCALDVTGISNANPGVVTTAIAHGLTTGTTITITGETGVSGINGVPFTATVIDPYNFSIGHDTTSSGAYVSGGVVTPNVRNQSISIIDSPDTYTIPFVNPLQETVTVALTWNTNSLVFVNPASVAALGTPAIVAYINSIPTGQPINIFEMQNAFQEAVQSLLPIPSITKMNFVVTVNGAAVSPIMGTGIIPGDAYSYFEISTAGVNIEQG